MCYVCHHDTTSYKVSVGVRLYQYKSDAAEIGLIPIHGANTNISIGMSPIITNNYNSAGNHVNVSIMHTVGNNSQCRVFSYVHNNKSSCRMFHYLRSHSVCQLHLQKSPQIAKVTTVLTSFAYIYC